MKHTHSISAFLALACFLLTASVHAQQWDNYRPDVTTVQLDSTNLPIMLIDVDGAMIFKDDYITARMKIIDNGQGNINYLDTVAHPGQHIGIPVLRVGGAGPLGYAVSQKIDDAVLKLHPVTSARFSFFLPRENLAL